MKKSLFSKLMSTYFIIMIISYVLISIFLSIWFYDYYYDEKKESILSEGSHVSNLVTEYANRTINKTDMSTQLSVVERLLQSQIVVYDNYGDEIKRLNVEENNDIYKKIDANVTKEELQKVMNGEKVSTERSLKGFMQYNYIKVGIPVKISDTVTYSVFINSSVVEMKSTLGTIYFVIWSIAILASIASAFVLYYFSERILIKPLGKINDTAKQISTGEFDNRVDIASKDEIGELAISFNYMADSLQKLEDMRKSFIANVSHELRSPMTSINGFVDGMLDGTIPKDKWERYLNVVSGESKRLMRIINDLLDLARLESGEFSMNMGSFEINELISESIIKFEDRICQKGVDMKVTLIKSGAMVKGDRDRINQVVTNLLDNAIKFVPDKGTIEVSAIPKDDRVVISVFNTGKPIPKEEINLVWERFHKVDKARKLQDGVGVGLGLSIIRQILNQHNQTIWVESSEAGNKFSFTLNFFK